LIAYCDKKILSTDIWFCEITGCEWLEKINNTVKKVSAAPDDMSDNTFLEQILVLVFMVGCFLLAEHQLALHKKGQAQVPLKKAVIVNNIQDVYSARGLLFFHPIDINSASFEELTLLPGIGEVTACRVIQFRQSLGFFLSVEELDTIKSPLSPKLLGAIAPYLAVEFDF
jgi:DNA uptake protein ComE-like DNA-binding protein